MIVLSLHPGIHREGDHEPRITVSQTVTGNVPVAKQLMHSRAALNMLSLEIIKHTSIYRTYALGGLRLEECLVKAAPS